MKVQETKLVDTKPELSEEDRASLKMWLDNRWTQNLKKLCEDQINIAKETWVAGAYISDNQKSLSDYNAGVAQAHTRIHELLNGKILTDLEKINGDRESD